MLSDDLHALQTATFEFDGGATNTVAEITVLERPFVATMFSSPEIILLAPTAAPCAGEVIDGVVLGRLRDDLGSPRALLQIVRLFLSELDGRAAMIEDTAGRAELAVLARGARHLRPSAATLGATVLADVLTALEDAAEAGEHQFRLQREAALRALLRHGDVVDRLLALLVGHGRASRGVNQARARPPVPPRCCRQAAWVQVPSARCRCTSGNARMPNCAAVQSTV